MRLVMMQRFAVWAAAAGMAATLACAQSDPGITAAVKKNLAADDTVKAHQIDVDTQNGVVTLSGSVDGGTAKERAAIVAKGTEGVQQVVNNIIVGRDAATATTGDAAATAREGARDAGDAASDAGRSVGAAASEFGRDVRDNARELGRDIKENSREIAGAGRDEAREAGQEARERGREAQDRAGNAADRAGDRASDAAGRTGNTMSDAAVTSAVKTKFLGDTAISGLKIDVDTKDGVVNLRGTVASKVEADRAETVARGTDGVRRVVNNLRIQR